MAVTLFVLFVAFVLGLSFYFGKRTQSASGYYAAGGQVIINGAPASAENQFRQTGSLLAIAGESGEGADTGPVGPFKFLSLIADKATTVQRWSEAKLEDGGDKVTLYYLVETPGNRIMRPGLNFKAGGKFVENLDFVSLMLALFFGTAALPHILIRYYAVPSPAAARMSTIVAIAAIGFFYILTMYMGLHAIVNAVINPVDNNMSAPLLARSFGTLLFAVISAIAFTTALGILVERQYHATGEYPESLDFAFDVLGADTLLDPFTGQPYRYVRFDDGDRFDFAVYSVGEDKEDDLDVEKDLGWFSVRDTPGG